MLVQQAASNSKKHFGNSPDLKDALLNAIMDALDAHQKISSQALGSERLRDGLGDILLGPAGLYEASRELHARHWVRCIRGRFELAAMRIRARQIAEN